MATSARRLRRARIERRSRPDGRLRVRSRHRRGARSRAARSAVFIVGTGRESTQAAIRASKRAAEHGADAVLVRTPGFFKTQMTTDAFVRHYTRGRRRLAGSRPALQLHGAHRRQPAAGGRARARTASKHRRHERVGRRHRADRRPGYGHARDVQRACRNDGDLLCRVVRRRRRRHPRAGLRCCPTRARGCSRSRRQGKHDEALALQRQLMPLARLLGQHLRRAGTQSRTATCWATTSACRDRRWLRSARRGGGGTSRRARRVRGNTRMSLLPDIDRILLGPGPSLTVAARHARDGGADVSHLDPIMMLALLDDVRARLTRTFRAADGSFAFAVSGTGTSGMETCVANLVDERHACSVVVTGYFGDRLAQMCERYGATGHARLDVEWGRACDPEALRASLAARRRPTSWRWFTRKHPPASCNPVRRAGGRSRATHGALTIVDAVTSFGGHPLDVGALGHRRLLQLHPEMSRRTRRAGAGRLRPARAREARAVPQLLLRSVAARRLLAAPEVPPHDVVDARLCAGRSARDRRRGRPRRAMGAARTQPPRAARQR